MKKVEHFIKTKAPGALYGEWAKKEECWIELKKQNFDIDFKTIKADFEDPKNPSQRKRIADEETALVQIHEELETIRTVPPEVWNKIEDWGRTTEQLSEHQKTVAYILAGRLRGNTKISDYERNSGINILDIVNKKAPEILEMIDEINSKSKSEKKTDHDALVKTIKMNRKVLTEMVEWDSKIKTLTQNERAYLADLAYGLKPLNSFHQDIAKKHLKTLFKAGFKFK